MRGPTAGGGRTGSEGSRHVACIGAFADVAVRREHPDAKNFGFIVLFTKDE
jgi:hypothetical protein